MKINISANNIDVRPHKASKPTDLPTILEVGQADFGGRTRAQMRRVWMRHARLAHATVFGDINFIEVTAKHAKRITGLDMLQAMNAEMRGNSV